MYVRTMLFPLAFATVCYMSGSVLWAQQKAKTPQRQLNMTRLNGRLKTARGKATGLKRLVDTLRSSSQQNRPTHLNNIVGKTNELLVSARDLRKELSAADKIGMNETQKRTTVRSLASLGALVEDTRRVLTAGSVDFTANCNEAGASCLEAACSACCRGRFSDAQALRDCQQYCRAQADLCQALDTIRGAMEGNSQSVRSMTST